MHRLEPRSFALVREALDLYALADGEGGRNSKRQTEASRRQVIQVGRLGINQADRSLINIKICYTGIVRDVFSAAGNTDSKDEHKSFHHA
jgi:hypothetical protein